MIIVIAIRRMVTHTDFGDCGLYDSRDLLCMRIGQKWITTYDHTP